jgi:hypothetical protein
MEMGCFFKENMNFSLDNWENENYAYNVLLANLRSMEQKINPIAICHSLIQALNTFPISFISAFRIFYQLNIAYFHYFASVSSCGNRIDAALIEWRNKQESLHSDIQLKQNVSSLCQQQWH